MRPIDALLKTVSDSDPRKMAREAIKTGRTRLFCPNCLKYYVPAFATKELAMLEGNAMEREQFITGLCSDKCRDEYLGPEEEE